MRSVRKVLVLAVWAFVLTIGLSGNVADAQDESRARPDFSWLIGNWKVSYTDRILGEVTGYAAITAAPGGGEPLIRYVVKHPQTGREYELGGTSVRIDGNMLEIKLFGASPSGAVTAEGESRAQVVEGATEIQVVSGANIKASFGDQSTQNTVRGIDASLQTHFIRFFINPANPATNFLDGRWKIERHWRSGFQGLRNGVRDEERHVRGALNEEVQIMSDQETWSRRGPTIDKVSIAEMVSFDWLAAGRETRDTSQPLTEAVWLRIEGKDLPVQRGERVRSVVFDDPEVKWTGPSSFRADPKVAGALQIEVQLGVNVRPGHKRFTLDGAPGVWKFDFPGLDPKSIRTMRKIRDNQFEFTSKLYPGEVYYVEVEFDYEPFYTERYFMTSGLEGNEPVVFSIKKLSDSKRVFRSQPFLLLEATQAPLTEAESRALMWNPADPDSPHRERGTVVRAKPGSLLKTTAADAVRPNANRVWGEVAVGPPPTARYKKALATAQELRQEHPERERYEASRWVLIDSRETYISVQDHAALILLHEELTGQIDAYVQKATRALVSIRDLKSKAYAAQKKGRVQWARALVKAADSNDDHFLFLYDVSIPNGQEQQKLDEALRKYSVETFAGATRAEKEVAHLEYIIGVVASAEGQAIDEAGKSLVKLRDVKINEPTELLKAVGLGYERVAASLMQELVRPSIPASGESFYPRWVPDLAGRAAVRGVGDLARAVRADEAYGSVVRLSAIIMTLPVMFWAAPAAGAQMAAGTWGAARIGLTAVEMANLGLVTYDMNAWDRHSEAAAMHRGNAVVAGTDAYRMEKSRADAALMAALLNGGVSVGVPLFMKAVQLGVRPTELALETVAAEAARRGVNRLGAETRATFEYLRGRAEWRIAKEGIDALSDVERQAIAAAYPRGFPPEVAERLGLAAGETVTAPPPVTTGLPPVTSQAERAAMSTIDDFTIDIRAAAPERSASPVMKKWYGALEGSGTATARAKQETLEAAEEMFRALTPAQQGRATEALEILDRLCASNPALANMDEATAARMVMFHAKAEADLATGGVRALDPEELAMRVAAWNRADVSPQDLAAAANISEMNAQAAMGRARGWANRFEGGRGGGGGAGSGVNEATTLPPRQPNFNTPTATDVTHSTALRQERIESILRGMGMNADEAKHAAVAPAATDMAARDAAAGAAMVRGLAPEQVAQSLGMTRDELRAALGRYHRRLKWEPNPVRREEMIHHYLNSEGAPTVTVPKGYTTLPPPTSPPLPSTMRMPSGLDGPVPSADAVRADVMRALDNMGVDRATAETLPFEHILDRVGARPDVIAAGAGRRLGVPPERMANALNADSRQLAGALDKYDEAMLPYMTASERAETVTHYMAGEGGNSAETVTSVMGARADRVDAALRDLGVGKSNPDLVWGGMDVETAVVGSAMDDGVSASTVMSRRNLTPDRLEKHVDEYLHYGQGMTDPAERAAAARQFLDGTYKPPDSQWRVPETRAPSIATESDIAQALERMGVESSVARQNARDVSDVAATDAHAGLAGAALHSKVPPEQLGEMFGMSNSQIARKMDDYLRDGLGMTDPAQRAQTIARNYFEVVDGPKPSTTEVRRMIESAPAEVPPLRPRSTQTRYVPPERPNTPPPPLQFAPDDLVYGPAAGGELRRLQQRAGGLTLNDLTKPPGESWSSFTARTLDDAAMTGRRVQFDLTYVEDIEGVLAGSGVHAGKVTSQELRYLRDHWDDFATKPKFYRNGWEVPPPWTW